MVKIYLFSLALMFSALSMAIVDGHEYIFEESERAAVFKQLAEELRCPKCQNQNLADSNAMIAGDLRREVYQQVKEGMGADEIKEFMVNRYGEFVLYKPKVTAITYVLWYGPGTLLLFAVICFILVVRHRKQSENAQALSSTLSTEDQHRLDALLVDDDTPSNDNVETKQGKQHD